MPEQLPIVGLHGECSVLHSIAIALLMEQVLTLGCEGLIFILTPLVIFPFNSLIQVEGLHPVDKVLVIDGHPA